MSKMYTNGDKYEALVLIQVRVEFDDDGEMELESQAYDALPLWGYGKDVEIRSVSDIKKLAGDA